MSLLDLAQILRPTSQVRDCCSLWASLLFPLTSICSALQLPAAGFEFLVTAARNHLLAHALALLTQEALISLDIFIPVCIILHFPVTNGIRHLPGLILSLAMSAWLSRSLFTSSPAVPPADFLPFPALSRMMSRMQTEVDLNFLLYQSIPLTASLS